MTSQLFFEVQFCHNQLEKPYFGQITELQVIGLKVKERWGRLPPALDSFFKIRL